MRDVQRATSVAPKSVDTAIKNDVHQTRTTQTLVATIPSGCRVAEVHARSGPNEVSRTHRSDERIGDVSH